jgi:hypothetical protein
MRDGLAEPKRDIFLDLCAVAISRNIHSVWTGRALQAGSEQMEGLGLAHLYPALAWSVCVPGHHGYPRAPDLILRKALRGRLGHQITGATARPFLHFLNPTADLGRYLSPVPAAGHRPEVFLTVEQARHQRWKGGLLRLARWCACSATAMTRKAPRWCARLLNASSKLGDRYATGRLSLSARAHRFEAARRADERQRAGPNFDQRRQPDGRS